MESNELLQKLAQEGEHFKDYPLNTDYMVSTFGRDQFSNPFKWQ